MAGNWTLNLSCSSASNFSAVFQEFEYPAVLPEPLRHKLFIFLVSTLYMPSVSLSFPSFLAPIYEAS